MTVPPEGGEPYPEPAAPAPAPDEEAPLEAPQESPPSPPFDDTGRPTALRADLMLAQVRLRGSGLLPFIGASVTL